LVADRANTVPLAPTATEMANKETSAIFLSIRSPCVLVDGR
jgi:hypothetical protein